MNKLIIDNYDLDNLVSNICRDITNSSWRPDYVVGLTRGGLTPAVMISHYFDIPCETLKVSLRDGGNCESNLWMAEDAFGYIPYQGVEPPIYNDPNRITTDPAKRKNILIVDDINDSGSTINWILKDWPSGCLPEHNAWDSVWNSNVRFSVLVDNLSSDCAIKVDYTGMEINKKEKDVWVVFPWENWWGRSQ